MVGVKPASPAWRTFNNRARWSYLVSGPNDPGNWVAMWPLILLAGFILAVPHAVGQSPRDPFAIYDASLDHQLSAIVQDLRDNDAHTRTQPLIDDARGEFALFAKQFWGGRDADLTVALKRLGAMRPTIESILQSEGIPRDLIGVVLIESAAQPLALSPRRARGLWQLIPETARQYGLEVREGRDQRVEIEAATHAAARYLRDLYRRFDDWPLALAAYNAGQDAVQRALNVSKAATFRQLSSSGLLPRETRLYVPAVLAAMKLLRSDPAVQQPIYAPLALVQIQRRSAW